METCMSKSYKGSPDIFLWTVYIATQTDDTAAIWSLEETIENYQDETAMEEDMEETADWMKIMRTHPGHQREMTLNTNIREKMMTVKEMQSLGTKSDIWLLEYEP